MQDYIPKRVDINGSIGEVVVKQYDHLSRLLHIQLLDKDIGGDPINLDGCVARIYIEPGFGAVTEDDIGFISGAIADGDNGIIKFAIPNSITQDIGSYNCEIYISDPITGAEISTYPFVLKVVKSIRRDGIIEKTPQFSALQDALNTVDGLDARIATLENQVANIEIPINHLSAPLQEPSNTIDSGTVAEMLFCATTYFNYAYTGNGQEGGILYKSHTGLYSDSLGDNAANGQFSIVCSSFACAMLNGVTFENSRYSGKTRNIHEPWGVTFDETGNYGRTENPTETEIRLKYLTSQGLARYAYEHGYLYPIDENHQVRPGDLVFSGNKEDRFLGVDHVAIVMNVDRVYCTVIESWPSQKKDIDGTPHDVGLRINCHDELANYTYGATFPLGSVHNNPIVMESTYNISGKTTSESRVIHQFRKRVPKGFYTIVCHGTFEKTPYITLLYGDPTKENGSRVVVVGDMMRVGSDYNATIYVEKTAYVFVQMREDMEYNANEISLYMGYADITTANLKSDMQKHCTVESAIRLNAGDDLDDCKTGIWFCQDTATAITISNTPLGDESLGGFRVETYQLTESERYMQRLWYSNKPEVMYLRMYHIQDGQTDSDWGSWYAYNGTPVT